MCKFYNQDLSPFKVIPAQRSFCQLKATEYKSILKQNLKAAHHKFQQWILGTSWKDKLRNDEVSE